MKSIKILLMSAAFLIVSAAAFSQSKEELRDRIENMNDMIAQQMVDGNYMAGLAYYSDDAISLPNWNPMIRGIDEMREENRKMMEKGIKIKEFDFETLEIMECGDKVIEIGKYKMSMDMEKMPETIHDHGKYMTVWEKQDDGSLKIKADIWNTSQDPMAMMKNMPQGEMHEGHKKDKKDYHDEKYRDKEKWEEKKQEYEEERK